MRKRLTTEQFIEKARAIHGDKYDYSRVVYLNNKTKVEIICPTHGSFFQRPYIHLLGSGCPSCGNKKLTTQEFIQKARKIHGDKYDYSRVVYVKSSIKVEIICPTHGSFFQTPNHHLTGCGCPSCVGKKSTEQFIHEAKQIHGYKYDYSKVDYVNNKTKVEIICPIHGSFFQTPNDHLKGKGCVKCRNESFTKTNEEFIEKAKEIHGDKYDYSKVDYVNNCTKVEIICPIHGSFFQTPNRHLTGCGCPSCKSSKGEIIIQDFLKENNVEFIPQHKFHDCKYRAHLPFDFYIESLNLCIEYDGEHHFHPVRFGGSMEKAEKKFKEMQIKDKIKEEYCKNNNIHFIRVMYSINDIPEYIMREMKRKKLEFHTTT